MSLGGSPHFIHVLKLLFIRISTAALAIKFSKKMSGGAFFSFSRKEGILIAPLNSFLFP